MLVLPEGLADGGEGAGAADMPCGAAPLATSVEAASPPWPAEMPGVPGRAGAAPGRDATRDALSRPSPGEWVPALPEPEVAGPEACGAFETCGAGGTTSALATVAAMLAEPADGVAAPPDPLLCAAGPLPAVCPRFCAGPLVAREIREASPAVETVRA